MCNQGIVLFQKKQKSLQQNKPQKKICPFDFEMSRHKHGNTENVAFLLLFMTQSMSRSRLEELFLCLNDYSTVSQSRATCPSLRLLQMTDNKLRAWADVRKLGMMYPGLSTLVLANNNVDSVGDTQEALQRIFPNLRSINLNNTGVRRVTAAVSCFASYHVDNTPCCSVMLCYCRAQSMGGH